MKKVLFIGNELERRLNNIKTPNDQYYKGRYIEGKDRWSIRNQFDLLTSAQIRVLSEIIFVEKTYTVLDIGCGTFWTAKKICEVFPNLNILGIDFAYDAIIKMYPNLMNELKSQNIFFKNRDFFKFKSEYKFDFIFDIGLFHHIYPYDWKRYSNQVDMLLKDDGSIFIHSFHPTDENWNNNSSGGHYRKGYYCHYNDISSLNSIFSVIFKRINLVELSHHEEHIVGLYHFQR